MLYCIRLLEMNGKHMKPVDYFATHPMFRFEDFASAHREGGARKATASTEFVPVPVPPALRRLPDMGGGVVEVPRSGLPVRVTTLERTLVDVLDAPRHGGGWEEIWRSLESVEFFDVGAVTDYALKLGSA